MKAPAPLASKWPDVSLSKAAAPSEPQLPVITTSFSPNIAHAQLSAHRSRKTLARTHVAIWRTAWFQPVLLTTSAFKDPQPPFPGPLGRAKLARNLSFAANFSVEEAMLPSLDQIAVTTALGERWITLNRFREAVWVRF
jgi:hypothetical protein